MMTRMTSRMTRGATAHARNAGAYARVGLESEVLSADPHRLICLLFDGVGTQIRTARLHMRQGRAAAKGQAISRALDIVHNGLLAALDQERGGELAERLAALYDYVGRLLLAANLRDDEASLDQAERLLEEVASGWRAIAPHGTGEQS